MLRSIFDLPTKKEQLESSNAGFARYQWIEKAPLRSVIDTRTNKQFANGELEFRWDLAATTWFQPNKCFLRIRVDLHKWLLGGGTSMLTFQDGTAPVMGTAAAMFQEGSVTIQDQTVSICDKHMGEIEAIYHRLNKTGQWMREVGQELNGWDADFRKRQSKVCTNYILEDNAIVAGTHRPDLIYAQRGTVDFSALDNGGTLGSGTAAGIITITASAVHTNWATTLAAAGVIVGALVAVANHGGATSHQLGRVETITATTVTIRQLEPGATDVDDVGGQALAAGAYLLGAVNQDIGNRAAGSDIELIWMPRCLSFFRLPHAIPGGAKFSLLLTPKSNYRLTAIHSQKSLANDEEGYEFLVKDIRMYIPTFEGKPFVDNMSFYLDLNEIRCQKQQIASAESSTNITVRPSTTAMAVAIQDGRVENDVFWPTTQFVADNDYHLKLTAFHSRYGGAQSPIPEFEISSDYPGTANSQIQYWTEVYARNMLLTGAFFDSSAESIKEFFDRGPYIYQIWNKSGDERETRMYIKTKFSEDPNQLNPPKLVIFNFYKKHAACTIRNGRYEELHINEA